MCIIQIYCLNPQRSESCSDTFPNVLWVAADSKFGSDPKLASQEDLGSIFWVAFEPF
jgi:hypothetical protein